MEIKKGYKMTDVGVIPEDWEVKSIGELFSFKNGLNKDKDSFGFGTPIINYMDVYKNNGLTSKDIKGKVSLNDFEINCFLVKKGDVFFTRTSETPEEVGLTSVLLEDIPYGVFSGFLLRARPKDNILDPFLCKYLFSNESFRSSVIQNSTYTTRALTNGNILSSLFIAFPNNKHEQQSIADALTKVDNLIMSLSKVIEKKKLIKKGTMQKLLSGEVRLDGYKGRIKSVYLSETGEIKAGGTPSTNVPSYWGGTINWLQSGAVKNRVLEQRDVEKTITEEGLESSSAYIIREFSVLIAITGATCGNIAYLPFKSAANQSVVAIQVNESFNSKYIFYMLIQNSDKIINNRGGSAQGGVSVNIIKEIEFKLHEDVDEQTAIANVLTTMDDEIEKLEKERDKYKSIKQGMMQQLLTGKIRLVCQ